MRRRSLLGLLVLPMMPLPLRAGERGSPEEARSLAEAAAAFLTDHGVDAALAEFSNDRGAFVDRDLYVFVLDHEGVLHAHGQNALIIGRNLWQLRDVDGRMITQNAINTALREQAGWTSAYRFPDPYTKKIGTKQSYVIAIDGLVIGVGFYLKDG